MGIMDKREQLIEAALELFYRQGFTATGIDGILAEAGVAKMTLELISNSFDYGILSV